MYGKNALCSTQCLEIVGAWFEQSKTCRNKFNGRQIIAPTTTNAIGKNPLTKENIEGNI